VTKPSAIYPPLPPTVDDAVEHLQRHIDRYHAGLAPDGAANLLRDMVESVDVRASDEYVAQRDKLAELGLDPDVLAPLPVDHKPVGFIVGVLTFPEASARAWLEASGRFSPSQVVDILARLRYKPEGLDEAVDAIEDRVEVADGRVLDVEVDRGRRRQHPLSADRKVDRQDRPDRTDRPRRDR
jgi:hypothetical protein